MFDSQGKKIEYKTKIPRNIGIIFSLLTLLVVHGIIIMMTVTHYENQVATMGILSIIFGTSLVQLVFSCLMLNKRWSTIIVLNFSVLPIIIIGLPVSLVTLICSIICIVKANKPLMTNKRLYQQQLDDYTIAIAKYSSSPAEYNMTRLENTSLNTIDNSVEKVSYFDGRLIQLIGWRLLGWLITGVTFGICYPFAVCMVKRWEVKHSVVNGKREAFNGNGGQLMGKYIVWFILTIITFGIYGLWLSINIKKWVTKHIIYQPIDEKQQNNLLFFY